MNERKIAGRYFRILFLLMLLTAGSGCDPRLGFVESKFMLANDSRLPHWVPKFNVARNNLDLEILLYTGPFGNKAKVKLYDKSKNNKQIWSKSGDSEWQSLSRIFGIPIAPAYNYLYTVIRLNGSEEVFKVRSAGVYYVFDPELHARLSEQSRIPKWLHAIEKRYGYQLIVSFIFRIGGVAEIVVEDSVRHKLVGQFRGKYIAKEVISETAGRVIIVVDGTEDSFLCESNEDLVLTLEDKG